MLRNATWNRIVPSGKAGDDVADDVSDAEQERRDDQDDELRVVGAERGDEDPAEVQLLTDADADRPDQDHHDDAHPHVGPRDGAEDDPGGDHGQQWRGEPPPASWPADSDAGLTPMSPHHPDRACEEEPSDDQHRDRDERPDEPVSDWMVFAVDEGAQQVPDAGGHEDVETHAATRATQNRRGTASRLPGDRPVTVGGVELLVIEDAPVWSVSRSGCRPRRCVARSARRPRKTDMMVPPHHMVSAATATMT